jgi:hypothetical protein
VNPLDPVRRVEVLESKCDDLYLYLKCRERERDEDGLKANIEEARNDGRENIYCYRRENDL